MIRQASGGLLFAALAYAQCVAVSGDRLEAGDLGVAALHGSRAPVGWAPAPGAVRYFSVRQINALLQRAGRTEVVSKGVCVQRSLQRLDRQHVLDALQAAWGDRGVAVELVAYRDEPVPAGRVEFRLAGLQRGAGADADFWRGRLVYGEGRTIPIWARVHLGVERTVLVAASAVPAGGALSEDGVRQASLRVHPLAGLADSPTSVAGARARRAIAAGVPIALADLWFPPAVSRGDLLTLAIQEGGVRLRLSVRAEAAGQVGDRIPVRNLENGRRIQVRVAGKTKVVPAL